MKGPPSPVLSSPSSTESDEDHSPSSVMKIWGPNHGLFQSLKLDPMGSRVVCGSLSEAKAPLKLDPTIMFELRNPIVMTSLFSSPLLEEYFASASTDYLVMPYDEWLSRRFGRNANGFRNSYFGSNGTPPMAKEKDALGKLFEKYRGRHYH